MQRPNEDRSERTKRHLIRNLLVNPELQRSPIPEQERSSPDSDSLPDLIVEPAPNRHDDPPEYYEGLEHRMKQYYRHLFLGAHGSDDDISSDFEVYRSMQIHEPRPERSQMARSGSPVLIPRCSRFRRGGIGTNSVGRHSGQSFNVLLASDENTKTFSPRKCDNYMERLPTASELIKASLDVYKTVQTHEEIYKSHAEKMREAMETRGNVSWHGETSQATATLAFEAPTSAKEQLLQDMSTDSNEMNATHVESEADHNIGRILEDHYNESSYDHSTSRITEDMADQSNYMSTPGQNAGKINASRQEIDNMNTSNFNKRKTAPIDENLPVKKKKLVAVQSIVEERKK